MGSSLELDEVLSAVVRLLSDASAVNACFVYLLSEDEGRLTLKAASRPYARLVDKISLERGTGIAWWAVDHREPAFTQNALEDPRNVYVPELEEEKFQSLLSVPITGKDGDVIGVISLHTEAPREFTDSEVEFLVSSASLVAGAIENAHLYEETRRRVVDLEHLAALGETIAKAETQEELLPEVAARGRELLRADACHVYLLEPGGEELQLRASAPEEPAGRPLITLAELGPELANVGRSTAIAVPFVANDELLGLLTAEGTTEVDLARAAAHQTAVALKKIDLIERLTEKNLIRDFFEQLSTGGPLEDVESRAARLDCNLNDRYLVLAIAPPDDALERRLSSVAPGSLFDRHEDSMRALLHVPPGDEAAVIERVRKVKRKTATAIGISNPCRGADSFRAGFEEAQHALLGTTVLGDRPGVLAYEELGPYKYLLRMPLESDLRDRHREAVGRLIEYDERRSALLLPTLEEYLRRRGNISATAEALYVHPNTLRQRLRRIAEISGLDLSREDWLMVEIALKMVKLEETIGTKDGHGRSEGA